VRFVLARYGLFRLSGDFFAEAFFGGSFNNGSINGDATHGVLGSHVLFDAGGSLGYHIDQRWSVLARFDHNSNGNSIFGTHFRHNQGLNNYGLMASYGF